MKHKILFSCLLIIFASCVSKQADQNPTIINLREFFGTVTLEIPNVLSTDQYHQMPDHSRDCITSVDKYSFVNGTDTGVVEIYIPLRGDDENLNQNYGEDYYSVMENELRWTNQTAKNYQRKVVSLGNAALHGFVFDDGFKFGAAINRGVFFITLTGVPDTMLREKIMKSIKLIPQ